MRGGLRNWEIFLYYCSRTTQVACNLNENYYIFQVANRDIPLQMYSDVVPNSDCPPTMLLRYITCATPTLKWELHRIHTEFGFYATGKDNTAR